MFDVELRLPKAIAFVHSEATHGHKPFHSNVIIPLSTPINPGDSLVIGYIKEHNDPTRLFDATKRKKRDRYFMFDTNQLLCNVRQKFIRKGANHAKNPAIDNW